MLAARAQPRRRDEELKFKVQGSSQEIHVTRYKLQGSRIKGQGFLDWGPYLVP
jgi:hypothetical protein